jgi:hypothetical protein
MDQHPVRLLVHDDLRRQRLTVFFRLLLALPHYVWAALWTIAVIFVAVASWVATLSQGRTPDSLHGFLARYVRYLTHLHAYLLLVADPYPGFSGDAGTYPVDLHIDPPAPQHRGKTAARIVLVVPAALVSSALIDASGPSWGRWSSRNELSETGAAWLVAFLAWFACLARGRMPRGLRDLEAYSLRYAAQTWAYLLLLTERYPDARPADPPAAPPDEQHPVALEVQDDLERSRVTVFFRLLLALPHLVWLVLWAIVALPVSIAAWVLTLVRAQLPAPLHRFFSAFLRYQAHLYAFLGLIANPFPGFTGTPGSYPVELHLPLEPEVQSRWTTLGRGLLVLPAWLISSALGGAAVVAAILGWFASLATGRMPRGLRDLGAWWIRYDGQANAYALFLTERYPYAGPYEFAEPPEPDVAVEELAAA